MLRSGHLETTLQYLREEENNYRWHDGAGVRPLNSRTLPMGEGPHAPGEGQMDGGLSQTFFRVYSNTGHIGIFRVTARALLWV